MTKRLFKHLASLAMLALLAGICVPALAGNTMLNVYIEKETLSERQAAQKAISSKNGELRVTRQSVYPWDEEGSHWSVFVELENTSDAPIVMDETWLYTCKADKETTATWHFPQIEGAFYRTAVRFYPGERVILYAGSEPVYEAQFDADGQYAGEAICAEGLDQIAGKMRSAKLLRVRISSRDTSIPTSFNPDMDEIRVPVQADVLIAGGKVTVSVRNDQGEPVSYYGLGAVLCDAEGNIVDVLRQAQVTLQPGESVTLEKELLPYVTDAMLEGATVEPYGYMLRKDAEAM